MKPALRHVVATARGVCSLHRPLPGQRHAIRLDEPLLDDLPCHDEPGDHGESGCSTDPGRQLPGKSILNQARQPTQGQQGSASPQGPARPLDQRHGGSTQPQAPCSRTSEWMRGHEASQKQLQQRPSAPHHTRLNTSEPLVPPKPKLFFSAASIFISRAVLAQ
jgi:hypothetical protein